MLYLILLVSPIFPSLLNTRSIEELVKLGKLGYLLVKFMFASPNFPNLLIFLIKYQFKSFFKLSQEQIFLL